MLTAMTYAMLFLLYYSTTACWNSWPWPDGNISVVAHDESQTEMTAKGQRGILRCMTEEEARTLGDFYPDPHETTNYCLTVARDPKPACR
jgi:hypothetical protein